MTHAQCKSHVSFAAIGACFSIIGDRDSIGQISPAVEALKNMGSTVEADLRSLLAFYGEDPDAPEAPKPEDFFNLILTFSSSLQVRGHLF